MVPTAVLNIQPHQSCGGVGSIHILNWSLNTNRFIVRVQSKGRIGDASHEVNLVMDQHLQLVLHY